MGKAPLRTSGKGAEGKGDGEDGDEEFYMDDVCMHASFLERFDAGRPEGPPKGKGKSKAKDTNNGEGKVVATQEGNEFSRISCVFFHLVLCYCQSRPGSQRIHSR
jgi:hypothetical protein